MSSKTGSPQSASLSLRQGVLSSTQRQVSRSVFIARPNFDIQRGRPSGSGQLGVWLPPLLAMLVIGFESTDTFSAAHTDGWLRPIVERLTGHLNDGLWANVHHLIRKTGHFCGFGLVCLTFLRAWLLTFARRTEWTIAAWRLRSCLFAVLSTAVIASADEWHQTFLPSRTGRFADVLLDTTGALLTCALVWLVCWRLRGAQSPDH